MCSSSEVSNEIKISQNNAEDHSSSSSSFGWRTNLFGLYAKVFKVMLGQWIERAEQLDEEERTRELDELVLPSNEEWRHQVYFQLVDLQREIDICFAEKSLSSQLPSNKEKEWRLHSLPRTIQWEWEPEKNSSNIPPEVLERKTSISAATEPNWRLGDILLAATVLAQAEKSTIQPAIYSDEAEMRRVFSLVYDVLRYKLILNQALRDADFWASYRNLEKYERIVWLILYDMQARKFMSDVQPTMAKARERVFRAAGLQGIVQALLESKTKLAASISRLRIRENALTMEKLLPTHLRVDGSSWSDREIIASGWINTLKIHTKSQFITEMSKLGLELTSHPRLIDVKKYSFDNICPKVVVFHDNARELLARSNLVREHCFILMDRSLCLGAASLSRLIRSTHLCGPVILTHCIAPRHTGYFAGLLIDIEEAGRLLAFGAGPGRDDHVKYLAKLGIDEQHCVIFAENYPSAPQFAEIERATIVLTIPPCSYTGLKDVVDLAVARGGDIQLLESLTNVEEKSKFEKPRNFLTQQISSLKYALTRPNVQLLIYEAHSTLPSETFQMLQQSVQYANKMATDKFIKDNLPKKRAKASSPKSTPSKPENEEEFSDSPGGGELQVPESDLFVINSVFDDSDESNEASEWLKEGKCYLAAARRKEMMQFNSLFMIKVAESKGLFGDVNCQKSPDDQHLRENTSNSPKLKQKHSKKKKSKSIELERITAPTHAFSLKTGSCSVSRQSIDGGFSDGVSLSGINQVCPRYNERMTRNERSLNSLVHESRRRDARRWWEQSANFLIHAARCESCKFRIFHTDPWTKRVLYPSKIQSIDFPDDCQSLGAG